MEPTPETRQLVNGLVFLNLSGGPLTAEQAAAWKENLRHLVQQGDLSVPAIREFLEKNQEVIYGADASALLGYASARMAMLDALTQIGSSQAASTLDGVLKSTADPHEIAQVAWDLEKLSPGAYKWETLDAARQTLALAASGGLPGVEVAPLFQVLQQYGGADAVADLQGRASQWNYYSTIALAQLPDEAGIPALIQIAAGQDGSSSGVRTAALQMLTGLASQSTPSADALVSLAQQNSLSPYDWATLAPFLAGNRMVFPDAIYDGTLSGVNPNDLRRTTISSGNQSYYTAPLAAMTTDQINQQEALIGKLLAVTTSPEGIQTLNQSKNLLESRRVLLANSTVK